MSEENPNENNNKKKKKIEINIEQNESSNNLNDEKIDNYISENDSNGILSRLEHSFLMVNQSDYYANSIPLGSFCFAISFILNGLHECNIHKKDDPLLYLTLLLFGGVGQITTGIFEYIKSRTFPCALYLTYGLYFLSYFFGKYSGNEIFNDKNQLIFYGSWAFLCFPVYLATFKTNIFLSIQNLATIAFFVIKCIGVNYDITALREIVPGILELVSGFVSLYICFGQILNEHYRFQLFPAIPFMKDNNIDDFIQ